MPFSDRLQTPGFRWTAAAALAVVALAALPASWPGLFVGPTGQISVLGGVGIAALLAAGLLLGWRWARYVTVAFLALGGVMALLWAVTNAGPDFVLGHLLLAAIALSAAGVLAFASPVRAYFDPGGAA